MEFLGGRFNAGIVLVEVVLLDWLVSLGLKGLVLLKV